MGGFATSYEPIFTPPPTYYDSVPVLDFGSIHAVFYARSGDIGPSSRAEVRGHSMLDGVKMAKIGHFRLVCDIQSLLAQTLGGLGKLLILGRISPFGPW